MVVVTDLKYGLETPLVKKLDLIAKRVSQTHPKKDACLMCEGGEGEGKTNSSVAIAYYLKYVTGRDIHLFFRIKSLIDFAKSSDNKIIIYDEPALDFLSTNWYSKASKELIQLLMMARKKRHVIIFNFTKFHKFSEYVVVDRCIGLIHMYSRKELTPGRFVYIKKGSLEHLYNAYRSSKKRLYKKYQSFRGSFPYIMEKYFSLMGITVEQTPNATLEDYEKEKDKAILSIGDEDNNKSAASLEVQKLKYLIATLRLIDPKKFTPIITEHFSITHAALNNWEKRYKID